MSVVVRFKPGFQSFAGTQNPAEDQEKISALVQKLDNLGMRFSVEGKQRSASEVLALLGSETSKLDKHDVIALFDDLAPSDEELAADPQQAVNPNRNSLIDLDRGQIVTTFGLRDGRDHNYGDAALRLLGQTPPDAKKALRALPPPTDRKPLRFAFDAVRIRAENVGAAVAERRVYAYPPMLDELNRLQEPNKVLLGDDPSVKLVLMRYLQALGYTHLTGANIDLKNFDKALAQFRADNQLAGGGAFASADLRKMLALLPGPSEEFKPGPVDTRFILEAKLAEKGVHAKVSLDRPTKETDKPWTPVHKWADPGMQEAYVLFLEAYVLQFFDTRERSDCYDLFIEATMRFAQQNELPFQAFNGHNVKLTHRTPSPIAKVKAACAARDLRNPGASLPLAVLAGRAGVVASMWWRAIAANHTYIVLRMEKDPQDPATVLEDRTIVAYASLTKTVNDAPLKAFNTKWGSTLDADSVPETLIDWITNYQGRGAGRQEEARAWASSLLEQHGVTAETRENATTAFIAMIAKKGPAGAQVNVNMSAPTETYRLVGEEAFAAITERDLFPEPTWVERERKAFNAKYLSAKGQAKLSTADCMALLRAKDIATSEEALPIARGILAKPKYKLAPESLDEAAQAFVAFTDASRAFRVPNFAAFDKLAR